MCHFISLNYIDREKYVSFIWRTRIKVDSKWNIISNHLRKTQNVFSSWNNMASLKYILVCCPFSKENKNFTDLTYKCVLTHASYNMCEFLCCKDLRPFITQTNWFWLITNTQILLFVSALVFEIELTIKYSNASHLCIH